MFFVVASVLPAFCSLLLFLFCFLFFCVLSRLSLSSILSWFSLWLRHSSSFVLVILIANDEEWRRQAPGGFEPWTAVPGAHPSLPHILGKKKHSFWATLRVCHSWNLLIYSLQSSLPCRPSCPCQQERMEDRTAPNQAKEIHWPLLLKPDGPKTLGWKQLSWPHPCLLGRMFFQHLAEDSQRASHSPYLSESTVFANLIISMLYDELSEESTQDFILLL